MDDVITVPPPTSIRTWAVVEPSFTSSTLPLMMLRALSRMVASPSRRLEVSLGEAGRGDRELRPPGRLRPVRPLADEKEKRRSEEHTSELQSPDHLVCRLLLEK